MGRKLRYLPDDNHLVEITCRVIQRRFLLRPSPQLKAIIEGTLAYFQKRHGMGVCGFVSTPGEDPLRLRLGWWVARAGESFGPSPAQVTDRLGNGALVPG